MRIGVASTSPCFEEPERAWPGLERAVREACGRGAELVVAPEDCFLGMLRDPSPERVAQLRERSEAVPSGTRYARCAALAAELKAHLIVGLNERSPEGMHKTAVVLGPNGGLLGRHRKVFLSPEPGVREDAVFVPGDRFDVLELPFGRVGVMVCYERRLPEVARELTRRGADLIACPSAGINDMDIRRMSTRAEENGVFVVLSSPHGSAVFGPDGSAVAQSPRRALDTPPHTLVVDVDLAERAASPCRRLQYFGSLAKHASALGGPPSPDQSS